MKTSPQTGIEEHVIPGKQDLPGRPPIYNRRWHLDADNRRHHGKRRWDPGAIEALERLAAGVEFLYPPDWSDENAVRFRASGRPVFAELWTNRPARLVLSLQAARGVDVREVCRALGLHSRKKMARTGRWEIQLESREQVESPQFGEFFQNYVQAFGTGRE